VILKWVIEKWSYIF